MLLLTLVLLICPCESKALEAVSSGQASTGRYLSAEFLLGKQPLQTPLATLAFTPPEGISTPAQAFEGRLTVEANSALNRIEVLVDSFELVSEKRWKLTTLPTLSFDYVSDGKAIIPLQREPQRTNHPYWEIILEPGRVWSESIDKGWSRAALPFALKEKNQNCTHQGLMTFLYKDNGSVSRLAWQVTSETCRYLKIDLWGMAEVQYQPHSVPEAEVIVSAYRNERANRLPVKPISTLVEDYPLVNPSAFEPPGIEDLSVYGFVIDGIHYRSECPTRYGPYPFCDAISLPSYSLAKSVFAGLGYLLLTKRWPEFADTTVAELIPECILDDNRWQQVTTSQLVNMTTGLYESADFEKDETATEMQTFFLAESHEQKIRFSCEAWPKKSVAGTVAVYHTTDTYLLGTAMNNFLKKKLGRQADIYTDLVHKHLSKHLKLSPLSRWTQRTYASHEQAFTGYGLIFLADDIAKIAASLNSDSSLSQSLTGAGFDAAMFRGEKHTIAWTSRYGDSAYSNGFWGFDIAKFIDCPVATWIPFMSGYGGNVVAMFPNDSVYYYFSDSGQQSFQKAAIEANKALNYCKES
jgi:hypothetical protein